MGVAELAMEAAKEFDEMLQGNKNVVDVHFGEDWITVVLKNPKGSIKGITSHYQNFPIVLEDKKGKIIERELPKPEGYQTIEEHIVANCAEHVKRADLPSRFSVRDTGEHNAVFIKDTKTGKEIEVGLCHLQGALQAIRTFCS